MAETSEKFYLTNAWRYAIYGAILGLCFPIPATLWDLYMQNLSFTLDNMWAAQTHQPLHWIIDTAPLFLGFVASLAGFRQDQLESQNALLEQDRELQTGEIAETSLELEAKNRVLTSYNQISQTIQSSLDLETVLHTLAVETIKAGIFRSLMVALVDPKEETIAVVWNMVTEDANLPPEQWTKSDIIGIQYALDDDNITAEVARTGDLRIIEEWDDRFDPDIEGLEDRKGKVSYFIPIKQGDQTLAVLATGSALQDKEDVLHRIDLLEPFFDQVATALNHAILYRDLEKAKEVAELASQSKGEFLSNMSHEKSVKLSNK